MIWIWVFMAVVLLGLGLFIFGQGGQNLGPAICTIGVVILLILLVSPARSHDHSNPHLNDWLKSLNANNKTWCCDGKDTDDIDEWETKGNSYRVKFRGQWFDVPEGAVVDGPNKGGDALLWMNKGYSGSSVRCFMPGSMT
jgi:hypothetical protein